MKLILSALLALLCASASAADAKRPNIVVFIADDHSRLDAMRADLDAWMKQQGDTQTVFGKPLLLGEPVTLITPRSANKK